MINEYGNAYKALFNDPLVRIISVSHTMTLKLMDLGCEKEKIIYNPYGPNSSFFDMEPNFSKPTFDQHW